MGAWSLGQWLPLKCFGQVWIPAFERAGYFPFGFFVHEMDNPCLSLFNSYSEAISG